MKKNYYRYYVSLICFFIGIIVLLIYLKKEGIGSLAEWVGSISTVGTFIFIFYQIDESRKIAKEQLNKTRELEFSKSRPLFILSNVKYENYENIDIININDPFLEDYSKEKIKNDIKAYRRGENSVYFGEYDLVDGKELKKTYITISNISEKPLLALNIELFEKDGSNQYAYFNKLSKDEYFNLYFSTGYQIEKEKKYRKELYSKIKEIANNVIDTKREKILETIPIKIKNSYNNPFSLDKDKNSISYIKEELKNIKYYKKDLENMKLTLNFEYLNDYFKHFINFSSSDGFVIDVEKMTKQVIEYIRWDDLNKQIVSVFLDNISDSVSKISTYIYNDPNFDDKELKEVYLAEIKERFMHDAIKKMENKISEDIINVAKKLILNKYYESLKNTVRGQSLLDAANEEIEKVVITFNSELREVIKLTWKMEKGNLVYTDKILENRDGKVEDYSLINFSETRY